MHSERLKKESIPHAEKPICPKGDGEADRIGSIETERLRLVPMEMKYLFSTHSYSADPENSRYMMHLPNASLEETRQFIQEAEEEWRKIQPEFYEYAILMDEHIGGISFGRVEGDPSTVEFGWVLKKEYWGRGICAEAARGLIQQVQEKLGIRHFIAHCDAENLASRRVMEKIGMRKTDEYGGRHNRQSPEERRECLYEMRI